MGETERQWVSEREGSGKGKGKERAAVATYFCFHFVLHFCYAAFVVFFSTRLHISIFHIFVSPNLLYDFCDVAKSHLRLLQKFHLFTFYAHVQNNNNNKWDIKKKLLRNKCRKSKTVFFSTRFLALILCLPFYIYFFRVISFFFPSVFEKPMTLHWISDLHTHVPKNTVRTFLLYSPLFAMFLLLQ